VVNHVLHQGEVASPLGRDAELPAHVVAVFFLNVGKVFAERVGVDHVRRFDAVQDHVHDRDDIGERLLSLAVESASLEGDKILSFQVTVGGRAG